MSNVITRFRTLAGRMRNDFLKCTTVVRTGAAQYEIQCGACGQGHQTGPFTFQSDATAAARKHANRCLA
jgi:hypothetical protein